MKPFRFGVQVAAMNFATWKDRVRKYEDMGFSTVHFCDHFHEDPQWDPLAGLGAIAALTEKMGVGTTVLDPIFYSPMMLARAGATLAGIAAGGYDMGLGAGRAEDDYAIAGISGGTGGERIARLDEALQIIRSLWTQPSTTFDGKFYQIKDAPSSLPLPIERLPRFLIGGMMPKMLHLAGKHADIVSVFARTGSGHYLWQSWAEDSTDAAYKQKIDWALDGAREAGRNPDVLELSTMLVLADVDKDADAARARASKICGLPPAQMDASHIVLAASPEEARNLLQRRREATGISYLVLIDHGREANFEALGRFADAVIGPLAGR